jgi:hypothetical protein
MAVIIKYTDTFYPMEIRLDVDSSETLKKCIDSLIKQGTIKPDEMTTAFINYNKVTGPNPDPYSNKHYPLEVSGHGTTLYIGGVTAGYDGEGPRLLLDILKNTFGMKIPFDVERAVLSETYDKDGKPITEIKMSVFRRYD